MTIERFVSRGGGRVFATNARAWIAIALTPAWLTGRQELAAIDVTRLSAMSGHDL